MSPESGRDKVSLKHGYWFYFEDEGARIVAYVSALSGKEVIFVDDEIVSNIRNFKFSATHSFEHKGHQYEMTIALEKILTGTISCNLHRDGMLVHKTSKSFHQYDLKRLFLISLCAGLVTGFGVGWMIFR